MGLYSMDKWLWLTVLAVIANLPTSAEAQLTASTPTLAEPEMLKYEVFASYFQLFWSTKDTMNINVYDIQNRTYDCVPSTNVNRTCSVYGKYVESGTKYLILYHIINGEGERSIERNFSVCTAPEEPPEPYAWTRWENNVTLHWNYGTQHNCQHHTIVINPPPTAGNDTKIIPENEALKTVTFDNLVGGTLYAVTITAVAGNKTASITSHNYTRPMRISGANVLEQTNSTLNISAEYNGENREETEYRIFIETPLNSESSESCNIEGSDDNPASVQCANTSNFTVTGLQDGTLHNLSIYTWLEGRTSETGYVLQSYTRPNGPIITSVEKRTTSGFTVTFSGNDSHFDTFTVQLCRDDATTCPEVKKTIKTSFIASYLTAGIKYKITVNTMLDNGLASLYPQSISSFTRPNSLSSITFPVDKLHENNATILITPKDDLVEIDLHRVNDNNTSSLIKTYNTMYITGLTAGTTYKVEVFTVTVTGLRSSEPITEEFNTRPKTPNVGEVIERRLDYISISLHGNTSTFDLFDITDEKGDLIQTVNRDGKFDLPNLTAGTRYTYHVFTNYSTLRSDGYFQIATYTKPEKIGNMTITNITNSSMNFEWEAPSVGTVTAYQSEIFCLGPNNNSVIKTFNDTSDALSAGITDLEPGSFCKIEVTTQINDTNEIIHGNPTTTTFLNRTTEGAPQQVQNLSKTHSTPRSITIEWERPSVRNGIIDEYEINVSQNNSLVQTTIMNCTRCIITAEENDLRTIAQRCADASVCDSAESDKGFSYNVTGLHPYKAYDISVFARTSLVGNEKMASYYTDESAPDGPPSISRNTTTATEIELIWDPPKYGQRNGIISKYNISYTFLNKLCYADSNGDNVTKHEVVQNNSTDQTLTGLDPYIDYYVRIQAFTSVGEGPFSDEVTISTKQSRPSEVIGLNASAITNKSISLSWSQPCRTNGEITNYTIYLTNIDRNITRTMTSSSNGSDIRDNILPYSNYTITVAGNTVIGEGNKIEGVRVRTRVGVPKIPGDVDAKNVSSTGLKITWATPELYTGPTNYTIVVTDNTNTSIETSKIVQGFHAKSTIIDELDQYWLYNIKVISVTEVGHAESNDILIRTDEDVPEEVKGLQVISEEDVTKPRTIKVKWNLLTDREKNGVLKSYSVRFSFHDTEKNTALNPTEREYVIKDINPGNYTIKVYASTEKGKGKDSSYSTTLQAGAPLKVPEPPGKPLMRQASIAVDNDETQIAIELPLESFLCNKSNGEPKEWGIIVSEAALATDEPFVGNKAAFDHRKNTIYTRWGTAKNMDLMPAYIATTPGVFDPCKSVGNRKKRSTSQSSHGSFTIGTDGKCSGIIGYYCNGELPPDHSFCVKSYVCTDGGCTETKYGQPIMTVPLQVSALNPTVPIAAVASSAVVVIVIGLIVVAALNRKQIACFKKDVESSSTHRPEDGIEFDRMESTKTRPFTPGLIKISDFPERVAIMHRNSDQIFADAYKLLGERSPKYSMLASEAQCSRLKNRYTNVLPFDHSRVKLRLFDDVEGSDYINANYIPGYTSRHEYIATQEPMRATFDDFWRMVWEQNVDTIVMLTMENGRNKCDKYWPDLSDTVHYGDLVVTLSSESNFSDYTIRIIQIKSKYVTKKVHQFCYLKWPDMGCLDKPHLLLKFVTNVRNYTKRERQDKLSGPMVVHCRTGIDRTGTFIAVDTLLQQIRDHDEVDIFSLVLEMRNQRLNMVQTEDQFVFIHECVNAFISAD